MKQNDNLSDLIKQEETRQRDTIMLIPSENYCSKAVQKAVGSVLLNKYSEGYPKRRYYQGNAIVDEIEILAQEQAKKLFEVPHVNVQPYSGSPANSAVQFALLETGDKLMGLALSAGGHLTHGQPTITFSGKYFTSIQFELDEKGIIDYDKLAKFAKKEKPKLLMIGTTAYPLKLNWKKFGEIADSTGAFLIADISHVSGLVVGGVYPSPVKYAHVVTTTTHKTLRGPRGAMIMVTDKGLKKDHEMAAKIDKAVFPGLQGGPHNNTTAGIAQALLEADTKAFSKYAEQIVKNALVLAEELKKGGLTLVSNGTECHLMVIDLRPQKLSGNVVAEAMEVAGLVANRNSVPFDTMPPFYPSGVRIGTPGATTRGMKERQMKKIAKWIIQIIDHVKDEKLPEDAEKRNGFIKGYKTKVANDKFLLSIAKDVKTLVKKYPMP